MSSYFRKERQKAPPRETVTERCTCPRKKEVALLATPGFSNEEITGKLFVGVSTIEAHLVEVYRKLGIERRSHLFNHFPYRFMAMTSRVTASRLNLYSRLVCTALSRSAS